LQTAHGVAVWRVLSPALIVTGALVLVALERSRPYEPRQRFLRRGFWTDLLGYTFFQSYALGFVITRLSAWIGGATGLPRLHLLGAWPIWLQVLFFVVTHDLYIYLFHRLQHRSPTLWRLHEAHHATSEVDWLSGSRSHAFEILINQSIEFIPIALLGGAPEVALIKVTLDALWGMYIHANVDVRSGRLQWLLNGPEMHRWHHALEIRDGVNFSTKFAFWDWLFRTAHLPPGKPSGYGISEPFPTGYLRQQLHLFLPRPNETTAAALRSTT
jgi:sterol desaturase/sphingolipid hydroxylase (fatty acid hydroxylase superfamily)